MASEPFQRNVEVSPRRDWPWPLRAIFWLSVSGLFIGTGQLFYFAVLREELGPPPTLQGTYSLVAWFLNLAIFQAGFRSRRRPFVLSTCATALLTLFVTAHFLAVTLSGWLDARRVDPVLLSNEVARELPTVAWNLAVIVTAAVIVAYLVSSHVVVTGERTTDRPSPLPPPVEIEGSRRS